MPGDSLRFDLYGGHLDAPTLDQERKKKFMKEYQSLAHMRWDCKYHIEFIPKLVFIPKRRNKKLFGTLRQHLGEAFRELASHKESAVVEGHLMPDHVHMYLSIPPKYVVTYVISFSSQSTDWLYLKSPFPFSACGFLCAAASTLLSRSSALNRSTETPSSNSRRQRRSRLSPIPKLRAASETL